MDLKRLEYITKSLKEPQAASIGVIELDQLIELEKPKKILDYCYQWHKWISSIKWRRTKEDRKNKKDILKGYIKS